VIPDVAVQAVAIEFIGKGQRPLRRILTERRTVAGIDGIRIGRTIGGGSTGTVFGYGIARGAGRAATTAASAGRQDQGREHGGGEGGQGGGFFQGIKHGGSLLSRVAGCSFPACKLRTPLGTLLTVNSSDRKLFSP